MKKDNKDTFTQAEISNILNNTVAQVSRPGKYPKGIPDTRLVGLRKVSEALIAPLVKFIDGENPKLQLMTPEELVFILTASALFVQTKWVMGRNTVLSEEVQKKIDALHGK